MCQFDGQPLSPTITLTIIPTITITLTIMLTITFTIITISLCMCHMLQVPYDTDLDGHGFSVEEGSPVSVGSVHVGGPAEQAGMFPGQQLVQINRVSLMGRNEREEDQGRLLEQCQLEMKSARQQQVALEVSVLRESAEYCTLRPGKRALGFQIKGTCPVVVQKVEKGMARWTTR